MDSEKALKRLNGDTNGRVRMMSRSRRRTQNDSLKLGNERKERFGNRDKNGAGKDERRGKE